MKRLLLLILSVFAASVANAQSTRTQATANLMGLGMPGPLASEVAGLATGLGVISNNVALKWRNAAGSANVDVLSMDGSDAVQILGGAGASSNITTRLGNASAKIRFVNSGGAELWTIDQNGTLDNSSGGSINLTAPGTTIQIEESAAGSKCMGSVTFNGTTAVTTATTCAAAGSRIFLTPTSDPTGSTAAYCWVTNIVAGTSFDVDCDQANDGTANWFIIKEAP